MIICSCCNKEICIGEDYIEDKESQKYIHFKCIYASKPLLNWIGYEVKTMEETYD